MPELEKKNDSKGYITVAGAVNVDIAGTPTAPLVDRDSNPGHVKITYGGVGRNIAENIVRLGMRAELLTVLGNDMHTGHIQKHCHDLGIGLQHALIASGRSTSAYLCINDVSGDMHVAVNDMGIYSMMTPEYLRSNINLINHGNLLVIDANIPQESIEYLAENCTVPILAEPVSTLKAVRFKNILPMIFMIKPNRLEAETLSGIRIKDDSDLLNAANALLDLGVKHVYISLGSEGVFYAGGSVRKKIARYESLVVNTTGCGDAFMAACAWGIAKGFPMEKNALLGLAAASLCVEVQGAVCMNITVENLFKRIDESGDELWI